MALNSASFVISKSLTVTERDRKLLKRCFSKKWNRGVCNGIIGIYFIHLPEDVSERREPNTNGDYSLYLYSLYSEVFMRNLVGQIWLKGEVSYIFRRFYHTIISRDNCEEDISILIPSETLCTVNAVTFAHLFSVFRPMADGKRIWEACMETVIIFAILFCQGIFDSSRDLKMDVFKAPISM